MQTTRVLMFLVYVQGLATRRYMGAVCVSVTHGHHYDCTMCIIYIYIYILVQYNLTMLLFSMYLWNYIRFHCRSVDVLVMENVMLHFGDYCI